MNNKGLARLLWLEVQIAHFRVAMQSHITTRPYDYVRMDAKKRAAERPWRIGDPGAAGVIWEAKR